MLDATKAKPKKKYLNIRLDPDLIALMERVISVPDTMYWARDRTFMIEHAIREQYTPLDPGNV